MRRIARVDRNQAEIVQALRSMGATVQHLHTIGKGCPDILVGFGGKTISWKLRTVLNPQANNYLPHGKSRGIRVGKVRLWWLTLSRKLSTFWVNMMLVLEGTPSNEAKTGTQCSNGVKYKKLVVMGKV